MRAPAIVTDGPGGVVRVFEHEPSLLSGLTDSDAAQARLHCVARAVMLPKGSWRPPPSAGESMSGHLGLLIIDGLIGRNTRLGSIPFPELLGIGDLLRPWQDDSVVASIPYQTSWDALEETKVAVLDSRFTRLACRWPAVLANVVERTTQRSRWLALQAAIGHVRRVDARLLIVMWHLADRWGRVRSDGVHVPVRLTHAFLGKMVGAQRPSVTLALNELIAHERLRRERDGTWTLAHPPPDLVELFDRGAAFTEASRVH